ncbi:MAG TPA: class I SAM-dependent methyltransferase [Thermoanaerobaculia bacterium]|nr:class I SAM-dependent methyltransferase [Thermoanaerobaculia bacterium]
MSLKSVVRGAFEEVKRAFPFDDYIDESTYHELVAIARALERTLGDFRSKKLLDVGSGPMNKTAVLQRLGISCAAVDDLSDPWHTRTGNDEKIKRFAADAGIDFRQHFVEQSLPFPNETFDVVCCMDIIEHLHESPRSLLNAVGPVLKTGGLLLITMPNSVNLRKRISVLLGRTNYVNVGEFFYALGTWRGHVREYTLSETAYIVEQAGYEVVSKETFEALAPIKLRPPLLQAFLAIASLAPTFRSGLLVLARKPASWKPLEVTEETARKLAAGTGSIPKGVLH